MAAKEAYLSIKIILMIFISTTAVAATLTGFANFGMVQGQANCTTSSSSLSSLTLEQKAAMRDPNNPSSKRHPVNTLSQRYEVFQ
jgi:hypothetical protein